MKDYDIMLLSLVGLLVVCLRARLRRLARRPLDERHMTGAAFDTSTIRPRIQRLREDYLVALPCRPQDENRKRGLIASARRALGRLSYFHPVRSMAANAAAHENRTRV
jgi:hypothetical protein